MLLVAMVVRENVEVLSHSGSQSHVAEKVQLFRDGRARTAVRRKVAPSKRRNRRTAAKPLRVPPNPVGRQGLDFNFAVHAHA
jgi:hypothetical protein